MRFKQIISIMMIMVVSLTIPASLFAEELTTTTSANVTVGTTGNSGNVNLSEELVLSDNTGAQLRIMQLQKAIQAQIDGGNVIINNLENENVSSEVIMNLKDILSNLENLSLKLNNTDLNQSADVLAKEFIENKAMAIELSKEFKDEIHNNLNTNNLTELKKKYQERKEKIMKKNNERIERLMKKYNEKIIERKLKKLGKENSKLIEDYKNGKLDIKEIQKNLMNEYKSLKPEERKKVRTELKEEFKKISIEHKQRIDETNKKINEFKNIRKLNRENLNKKIKELRENNRINKENINENIEKAKRYIKENNISEEEIQRLKEKYQNRNKNQMNMSVSVKINSSVDTENNDAEDITPPGVPTIE